MSEKNISLNQFGFSFQMKTITLLLTDVNFFQQIYDILEDDYFENEANEWIVKTIKDKLSAVLLFVIILQICLL